jgi:uncharacterized protein YndB with AHSA1/START domain
MREDFIAKVDIFLEAPRAKVWEALTDPDQVARYLHGTHVESDWKVGGPISWKGEWNGRRYEDRGRILEVEPPHRLATTYWSSLSGQPDVPEHHKVLRHVLYEERGGTRLVLTTENNATAQEARHAEENWRGVLGTLKAILEEETAAASGF